MQNRVYSFSVRATETKAAKLVEHYKLRAIREGRSFSYFVLAALTKLKATEEAGNEADQRK